MLVRIFGSGWDIKGEVDPCSTTTELWKGEEGSWTGVGEYLAVELIFGSSGLTRCSNSDRGEAALGEKEICSYVGNSRD